MSRTHQQLKWLIAIRMVAITSMVLPYVLYLPGLGTSDAGPRFLYYLAAGTYGLSLLYIGLLRTSAAPQAQAFLQLVGDLLIVTGLVYYFGGASSAFSLLYLVVIAVGSILLPRRIDLVLANLAWALYASLVLALTNEWIQPAGNVAPQSSFLTYNLVIHLLGFNAVALLVSYVSRNMTRIELELEQKQEDLDKLESFHRDVTRSLSSGLITTDPRGIVETINPAGIGLLQRDIEEIVGQPVYEVGVCNEEQWRRLVRASHLFGRQREESSQRRPNGQTYIVGYHATPLLEDEGGQRGFIVMFQDVTRFRQLEQEVRMKDRMAAIGELSAGIAHEIRNPLAAISGSAQMLAGNPQAGSSGQLLEIIKKESGRLDRTIEGFLRFSRPTEMSASAFDIAAMLRENVDLLRNSEELHRDHQIDIELEPESAEIVADKDQVSQIFWNLSRNALKAMPQGGRLVVRGTLDGGHYRIEFRDTGRGMTAEERRTLFLPFKTSFHGGTGLGMAIVYRLVEEHRGDLSVESAVGKGTTVSVVLPVETTNEPALDAEA